MQMRCLHVISSPLCLFSRATASGSSVLCSVFFWRGWRPFSSFVFKVKFKKIANTNPVFEALKPSCQVDKFRHWLAWTQMKMRIKVRPADQTHWMANDEHGAVVNICAKFDSASSFWWKNKLQMWSGQFCLCYSSEFTLVCSDYSLYYTFMQLFHLQVLFLFLS